MADDAKHVAEPNCPSGRPVLKPTMVAVFGAAKNTAVPGPRLRVRGDDSAARA